MAICRSCSADVAESARFCSSCGASFDVSTGATDLRSGAPRPPSSGSIDHGRFVPGTMFASRYRIVGLLGKGGMGEVYRADDLKLSQSVALKLLPRQFGGSEERRSRLLGEVRLARQISSPHVCRVYDVGESDGEHFITMEFVQGEDLASLLHRIGRLPKDKALEVARQICAGLAAAHERGVLHRDLKPANVMLDEKGRVRLTDFGLAAGIDDPAANAAEGTPAYMAPEQLAGREVTVRSDIYALGLVLYEIFTGRRAYNAESLAELREIHAQKSITDPSRIVDDLEPAVERVILRCLEENPRDRPPSVLAVALALPGGDPLAAAIAAGETPSPELLAAAGDNVGLKPAVALPLLLVILLGVMVAVALANRRSVMWYVDADLPPDALAQKARETLAQLGYRGRAADTARGWEGNRDLLQFIRDHDKTVGRWKKLRNGDMPALFFWYRESPRPLAWTNPFQQIITSDEPPNSDAHMMTMRLDPAGHLVTFEAIPDPLERPDSRARMNWAPLLASAGIDPATVRPVEPKWLPRTYADTRAAWEGKLSTGDPLRIEAAALNGRAVSFAVSGPWTHPPTTPQQPSRMREKLAIALPMFITIGALAAAAFVARRNLTLGRGDRRGAMRIGSAVFACGVLSSLLYSPFVADIEEVKMFMKIVAVNLMLAAFAWLLYVALEPYVRRRWPHGLIAWGKVLAGRFRDPLVGRDLLIGLAGGVVLAVVRPAMQLAAERAGIPPPVPQVPDAAVMGGFRQDIGYLMDQTFNALFMTFMIAFLLMLIRAIVRREWIAFGLIVALFSTVAALTFDAPIVGALTQLIAWTILLFVLTRFGILATIALVAVPMILGPAAIAGVFGWYSYTVWLPIAYLGAVAIAAFYTALAGRPVFGQAFMEG